MIIEFKQQSIHYLNENTPRIEKCFALLTEEEVWQRSNARSNSIGNLILHLCGNITQYIISALSNKEDHRQRDEEFDTEGGFSKDELLQKLKSTVWQATEIINDLKENELVKIYHVQGSDLSGIGIIIHVVEHYSYHTGQISFYTKLLKDKDLGYYTGHDLNAKNKPDLP